DRWFCYPVHSPFCNKNKVNMQIHLYQVIVVGISSVMLYLGIKEFINRETGQTILKLSVRLAVWGGMGLIAIYPDFTLIIARIMGWWIISMPLF
ncbi:hypothetical protein VT98_10541, partial [Candidatus Electrothrix communis]